MSILPGSNLPAPETLPCSKCDREMQLDALDVVTRLYVYVCDCGNERTISRTELEALVFGKIESGLGFGRTS
jgi:hypothetical protein